MLSRRNTQPLGWAIAGLLAFAGSGCGGKAAPIPPGWEPLDPTNMASFPGPMSGNQYPEVLNVVFGTSNSTGAFYADGEGYIDMPILAVWKAMQTPKNVCDIQFLSSVMVTATDVDNAADFSYDVSVVTTPPFPISFDLTGRELVTVGTKADPTTVVFRDDLLGTSAFLTTLSDSIVLNAVNSNTTSYSVIRHAQSLSQTDKDTAVYITDIYNQVKAVAHGMPLPTY